jgi:mannonate dehydratase
MTQAMRLAIGQFNELTHERLTFAKQLGVGGVQLNTPVLPGDQRWELRDLQWLVARCASYGLRLEAIENTPIRFYDQAMRGLPGRDEQIEHYQATIRNLGAAGIPILGYHWMPNGVWRTSRTTPGRGGALVTAFDLGLVDEHPLVYGTKELALVDGEVRTEAEMWQHYTYFMQAVLPVAEAAGVKLALHPDDPPIPMLGGVPRIFYCFEHFKRALELVPSPNSGLDFCMGCWSEMGPNVLESLRYFGSRGKIFYVHFRDVQGSVPSFQECFLGEGNVDVVAALRTLKEVGFTGFILDDHVPHLIDDTEWAHRGRAHQTGYIAGLLAGMERLA